MRQLREEGYAIDLEDLAHISPYLTEHIKRFGEYSTHEHPTGGVRPEAECGFLREENLTSEGFGQAA